MQKNRAKPSHNQRDWEVVQDSAFGLRQSLQGTQSKVVESLSDYGNPLV